MRERRLLCLDFMTLGDYLHLLRGISLKLQKYNESVMYYLAAAVSDFYIPRNEMVYEFIFSSIFIH